MNASNKSKAYGWLHNLNYYWWNKYYYYSDGTPNIDYEELDGCEESRTTQPIFWLNLLPNSYYNIEYYNTRIGIQNLPQNSTVHTNSSGILYLDVSTLGCDSISADYAFKVSIASNFRTSDTSAISNEQQNTNIIISPNPSDGIFNITFIGQNNLNNKNEFFVYDPIGNLLFHENNIANTSINLSNQPKGVYYLKVSINNNDKYFKLIHS